MAGTLVLVTGGAGFIGSTIARALIAEGTPVRVFDNLIAGFREVVPPEAEFQLGDLRDPEAIGKACEGVDVVYHQAALRSVAKSVGRADSGWFTAAGSAGKSTHGLCLRA